jgi:hypothetical protein
MGASHRHVREMKVTEEESAGGGHGPASDGHDPTSKNHQSVEHRAWWATIKALTWTRVGAAIGALGLIAALVFGLVSACGSDEPAAPGPSQSGTGNNYCADGSTCDVDVNITHVQEIVQEAAAASGGDEAEFKKNLKAADGAAEPPKGSAPYPFVVIDTGELGLFARTTNVMNGVRVGNAGNRALVWANCIEQSDFTPSDVTNNAGPQWVQVRWKHLEGGQVRGLSEPNETQAAWMYRGGLEPVGHNGDIPRC